MTERIQVNSRSETRSWLDGMPDMTIVAFPIHRATIAELNACIACSGRAVSLPDNLESVAKAQRELLSQQNLRVRLESHAQRANRRVSSMTHAA